MKEAILILLTVFLISCSNITEDNCDPCFTPPPPFIFEILDKTSGENLFENETFISQEIEIINTLNNNSSIEFEFNLQDNFNVIQINSIGWSTEIVNLEFYASNQYLFTFYVDVERKQGECCEYTEYNEVTIMDSEFEEVIQHGYKIFLE